MFSSSLLEYEFYESRGLSCLVQEGQCLANRNGGLGRVSDFPKVAQSVLGPDFTAPNSGLFLLKHIYFAQILFPGAINKIKNKKTWTEGGDRKKKEGRKRMERRGRGDMHT